MTQTRIRKIPSRLKMIALAGGGITAGRAIERADNAVERMRDAGLMAIDEAIGEMTAQYGAEAARADADFQHLYKLATNIIDMSGYLPKSGLREAAHSLCGLVDRCWSAKAWDWRGVDVHLDAIRLLRAQGSMMPEAARDAMLSGLSKVSRKFAQ